MLIFLVGFACGALIGLVLIAPLMVRMLRHRLPDAPTSIRLEEPTSAEPTGGGHGSYRAVGAGHVPRKPPDAAGGGVGGYGPPATSCRGVVFSEAQLERLARFDFVLKPFGLALPAGGVLQ